jgi:hypothetical protein
MRGARFVTLLALAVAPACRQADADSTWWNTPLPVTPSPSVEVLSIGVSPRALEAGESAVGTVSLTAAAPAQVSVTLTYTDASIIGPNSVTIPAGASSATFGIGTRAVPSDVTATLTADSAGHARSTSLTVFSIQENSFWYDIEPRGFFGHYTAPASALSASCSGSNLDIRIDNAWFIGFSARSGQPLRTGAYENVNFGASDRLNGLFVSSTPQLSPSCLILDAVRRYTITELNLPARGPVQRFVGSFEESCRDGSGSIRGAIRLLNPSPAVVLSPSLQGCVQ